MTKALTPRELSPEPPRASRARGRRKKGTRGGAGQTFEFFEPRPSSPLESGADSRAAGVPLRARGVGARAGGTAVAVASFDTTMAALIKSTAVSENVVLSTRDVVSPAGALLAVEYSLEVSKDRVVVFNIDFAGSTNLTLRGAAPGEGLCATTTVQPFSRAVVAYVEVRDPAKAWVLESRYTWIEETPSALLPGASKREVLGDGVAAVTSRSPRGLGSDPDAFTFEGVVDKNAFVRFTLDATACVGMEFVGVSPGTRVASVVVGPYSRAVICVLAAKNLVRGYALKHRLTWEEAFPASDGSSPRSSGPGAASNGGTYHHPYASGDAASSYRSTPPATTVALARAPPPATAPASLLAATRQPLAPREAGPAPGATKRVETLAEGVSLSTELVQGTPDRALEIVYTMLVQRPRTTAAFSADFAGSINLAVSSPLPGGGPPSSPLATAETLVQPFRPTEVARLRCVNPALGWRLVCKYVWSELDEEGEAASPPAVLQPQPSPQLALARPGALRDALARVGLEAYYPYFVKEDLADLELLRMMARDPAEFRHTLEQVGVAKIGHREKILRVVREEVA